jgi:DNA-binding transcriptional ArsR family regulator
MDDTRDMDAVFQALAHESRRQILDIVKESPGIGVGELAACFDCSRVAVIKHLAVLEQANLLHSERHGRTRRLYFNAIPIQMIYDRWTTEYSAYWSGALTAIKYRAEARNERERASQSRRQIKRRRGDRE